MVGEFLNENKVDHGLALKLQGVTHKSMLILAIISKLSAGEPTKWYQNVSQAQKTMNMHIETSPFETIFGTIMHSRPETRILELLNREQTAQFIENRHEMRKVA